jgi:hypothetical protein
MKKIQKQILIVGLIIFALSSCTIGKSVKEEPASTPIANSSTSAILEEVCPIPPKSYRKIPGYQPDSVDPSLSQKTLQFISPILEGDPTFYLGILQQPVRFCGTAKDSIVKVKFFASGTYVYEKKYPVPAKPELLLGEAPVKSGIWFFSYDFKDGEGVRRIIAKGYDSKNNLVDSTSEISITLAGPNPS